LARGGRVCLLLGTNGHIWVAALDDAASLSRRGRSNDAHAIEPAIKLRDRIIAAGLSIYEPDPPAALKARPT